MVDSADVAQGPIISRFLPADNIEIDLYPFKGPFKGKGANRRAMRVLVDELAELKEQMIEIIDEYNRLLNRDVMVTGSPRPPVLSLFEPRGIPQLWWREPTKKSEYIKSLFGSKKGREYLKPLGAGAISMIMEFDVLRLYFNLKSTMVGHSLEHYRKFTAGMEILESVDA